jgi:RNA polymerase sigma-70 factor, Bacteroides expansion family 1
MNQLAKGTLSDKPIIDDNELLDRLSRDDQTAFKELYKRYWKECYQQVLHRSGDPSLAEDITQGVFVALWEKRGGLNIQNLSAYLFTAVRFRFISYVKSQLHREAYARYCQHDQHSPESAAEARLRIAELNEAINKGIAMMPAKTKMVYTLSRTEHYSVKEIASKLGLSEKAVEYHITQSLKAMRLALKDFLPIVTVLSSFL